MFASAHTRLRAFFYEFCVALVSGNIPHMKQTVLRIVLLSGEVTVLRCVVLLLEKFVSLFFSWNYLADCRALVDRFDRQSWFVCSGNNGSGGCRTMVTMTTARLAMA